jgi:hypothetical protein
MRQRHRERPQPLAARAAPSFKPEATSVFYLAASGYQLSWDGTTVAFAIEGGATLWWAYAGQFAPAAGSMTPPNLTLTLVNPQVNVTQIRVELTGARWPGTDLAADFSFTCTYSQQARQRTGE